MLLLRGILLRVTEYITDGAEGMSVTFVFHKDKTKYVITSPGVIGRGNLKPRLSIISIASDYHGLAPINRFSSS